MPKLKSVANITLSSETSKLFGIFVQVYLEFLLCSAWKFCDYD